MVFSLVLCRKPELYGEIERQIEGFGWHVHISWHPTEAVAWLAQLSPRTVPVVFIVAEEPEGIFDTVIRDGLLPRNIMPVRISGVEGIREDVRALRR